MSVVSDTSSEAETEPEQVGRAVATSLVRGLQSGQVIYTGATLGVFERLARADGPTAAAEVAADLGLHGENTYRLLRALAHYGVLEEHPDRRFSLTAVGRFFLADRPDSVRETLLFLRSPEWVAPYLHLPAIVRTGGPDGFVREFGRGIYDHLDGDPEFAERFGAHLAARARGETDALLRAFDEDDLSAVEHVCDVGGGRGHLLSHLLAAYPHLDGTVLDRPAVVAETDRRWASTVGVADRCRYVGGDMFERVPAADAYLLKWVLHNWDDEAARRLLATVAEAAPPEGRLFVVEAVVPGPDASHYAKRLDVAMMAHTGGRERTEAEHAALLERSGWTLDDRWEPEGTPVSVLVATPA